MRYFWRCYSHGNPLLQTASSAGPSGIEAKATTDIDEDQDAAAKKVKADRTKDKVALNKIAKAAKLRHREHIRKQSSITKKLSQRPPAARNPPKRIGSGGKRRTFQDQLFARTLLEAIRHFVESPSQVGAVGYETPNTTHHEAFKEWMTRRTDDITKEAFFFPALDETLDRRCLPASGFQHVCRNALVHATFSQFATAYTEYLRLQRLLRGKKRSPNE